MYDASATCPLSLRGLIEFLIRPPDLSIPGQLPPNEYKAHLYSVTDRSPCRYETTQVFLFSCVRFARSAQLNADIFDKKQIFIRCHILFVLRQCSAFTGKCWMKSIEKFDLLHTSLVLKISANIYQIGWALRTPAVNKLTSEKQIYEIVNTLKITSVVYELDFRQHCFVEVLKPIKNSKKRKTTRKIRYIGNLFERLEWWINMNKWRRWIHTKTKG